MRSWPVSVADLRPVAGIPAHVVLVPPVLVCLALLLVVGGTVEAVELAVAGQAGLDGGVLRNETVLAE